MKNPQGPKKRIRPVIKRTVAPATVPALARLAAALGVSEGRALDAAVEHFERVVKADGPPKAA